MANHQPNLPATAAASYKEGSSITGIMKFWRRDSTSSSSAAGVNSAASSVPVISLELWKKLDSTEEATIRLEAIKEARQIVEKKELLSETIEALYGAVGDLLLCEEGKNSRSKSAAIDLFVTVTVHQRSRLPAVLRASFFEHAVRLGVVAGGCWFEALTTSDDGDKVTLTDCRPSIVRRFFYEAARDLFAVGGLSSASHGRQRRLDFRHYLQRVLKCEAARFDEETVAGLLCFISRFAGWSAMTFGEEEAEDQLNCLAIVDEVVSYAFIPVGSIEPVLSVCCVLLSSAESQLPHSCWKLVKTIMKGRAGYHSVAVLCSFLSQPTTGIRGPVEVRSAVAFLTMALWGRERLTSLQISPAAVLPSFRQAAMAWKDSVEVLYEISLSLLRLVTKFGHELHPLSWRATFAILEQVESFLEGSSSVPRRLDSSQMQTVSNTFHLTLTKVETLIRENLFNGELEALFSLVERCRADRPESSLEQMLDYQAKLITPTRVDWICRLRQLLVRFVFHERRSALRLAATNLVRNVYTEQRRLFEVELFDNVVGPLLLRLSGEEDDHELVDMAVNLLFDVLRVMPTPMDQFSRTVRIIDFDDCSSPESAIDRHAASSHDVFSVLIKVLQTITCHHLRRIKLEQKKVPSETSYYYFVTIQLVYYALCDLLDERFSDFSGQQLICLLDLLVDHLMGQYANDQLPVDYNAENVRQHIICNLLSLRADGHTGFIGKMVDGDECPIWSTKFVCKEAEFVENVLQKRQTANESLVKHRWSSLAAALVRCVDIETSWIVLRQLLVRLEEFLLQARLLVLTDLAALASLLSSLTNLPSRLDGLDVAAEQTPNTGEITEALCPVLAIGFCFANRLSTTLTRHMFGSILSWLTSDKSVEAIRAALIYVLQLTDEAAVVAGKLVVELSKLGVSPRLAIHQLELLVALVNRPQTRTALFACERTIHTLLDILFPYTNVERFTPFIVFCAYQLLFHSFLAVPLGKRRLNVAFYIASNLLKSRSTIHTGKNEQTIVQLENDLRAVLCSFLSHFVTTNRCPLDQVERLAPTNSVNFSSKHWILSDRVISVFCKMENCCMDEGFLKWQGNLRTVDLKQKTPAFGEKVTTTAVADSSRRRHKSTIQPRLSAVDNRRTATKDDSSIVVEKFKLNAREKPPPLASEFLDDIALLDSESFTSSMLSLPVVHDVVIRYPFGRLISTVSLPAGREIHFESILAQFLQQPSKFDSLPSTKLLRNASDSKLVTGGEQIRNEDVADLSRRHVSLGSGVSHHRVSEQNNDAGAKAPLLSNFHLPPSAFNADLLFLQMCQGDLLANQHGQSVLAVSSDRQTTVERSLRNLDNISSLETVTVGVIYVGRNQTEEDDVLSNLHGSDRYQSFLERLGYLISLKEAGEQTFLGGLSKSGEDGLFTYGWKDSLTRLVYHVTTLMPNGGDMCLAKKRLVTNDMVLIVYNNSGMPYRMDMLSGRCAHVIILVEPADPYFLLIRVQAKDEISQWMSLKRVVVADESAGRLCRELSLRADESARIWQMQQSNADQPYLFRALERYRHIRALKERLSKSSAAAAAKQQHETSLSCSHAPLEQQHSIRSSQFLDCVLSQ